MRVNIPVGNENEPCIAAVCDQMTWSNLCQEQNVVALTFCVDVKHKMTSLDIINI